MYAEMSVIECQIKEGKTNDRDYSEIRMGGKMRIVLV